MFQFSCAHCVNQSDFNNNFQTIEKVHKHWISYHNRSKSPKPFQFYVSEIVKCYYCSLYGSYNQMHKHHRKAHPLNPFGIVNQSNKKRCAICDSEWKDMIKHFNGCHKEINDANVFNPMCISNDKIKQLLEIDVSGKRYCNYCTKSFELKSDLIKHYTNDHNEKWFGLINNKTTTLNDMIVSCTKCDKNILNNDYIQHIECHSFRLKCFDCTVKSSNLIELVTHSEMVHGKIDTLNDYISLLSDQLKLVYFETKIYFENGLILVKHNLLATDWNDSPNFGQFITKYIQTKRTECHALIEQRNNDELKMQKSYLNSVIVNLPIDVHRDDKPLFLAYCDIVDFKLNANDIKEIKRLNDEQLIVDLMENAKKEELLQIAQEYPIDSGDFIRLPPNVQSKSIKIESYLTEWYRDMQQIASNARKTKNLLCFWINENGMAVRRTSNCAVTYVLSKKQLIDYIKN